jgi:hypothetical protein
MNVQTTVCVLFPTHGCPPLAWDGLSHLRVCCLVAIPHVAVH